MDALRRAARRRPASPAIVEAQTPRVASSTRAGSTPAGDGWSFAELDRRVDAVALALIRSGLEPGALVAMRLVPSPEAVVLVHAVARAGGVLVALHPSWTEDEVEAGLRAAGRPAVRVDEPERVARWMADGRLLCGDDAELPDRSATDPSVVILTSGSTGAPRPVVLTHGNLEASAGAVTRRLGLRRDDGWLTSLSLAHVGGLTLVHRAAFVGSRLVVHSRFDPSRASELIEDGAVTHASLVPVMLRRLIAERGDRPVPPSLRCLLVGGAAAPPPLIRDALALGYPIALTYGLTEATSQVATADPDLVRAKPGTVGTPLAGLDVRVGGGNERGVAAAEILVWGPTVARPVGAQAGGTGRSGAPTSADPPRGVHVDAEGWLHTGDLGRFDADGDLWITGRLSDRIVTGGVTVDPAEVEAVLAEHPGVREVAVVGAPDEEWGERLVAVVVPRDPAEPPVLAGLLEFSRARLSGAKRPRELRLVPSLPRSSNGKVDRARLRSG